MNKDIQIKKEPMETDIRQSTCKIFNLTKQETEQRYSTDSINTTENKRKSTNNSSPTKRSCTQCNTIFTKSDNLMNRTVSFKRPIQIGQVIYVPIPIRSSHIENIPLDLSKSKEKNNEKEKLYQCKFCLICFHSLTTLQAHQDHYCIKYQKQKTNSSENSPSSLFHCRLCKYRGNTLHEMHKHLKVHLSNEDIIQKSIKKISLLQCTICSAMFNNEEILLKHIKSVHTNERLIECLECRSRFSSKWNLIRHMKLLHTNIKYDEEGNTEGMKKNFSCPFCYIKFANINTLKQHMMNYCSSRPTINKDKSVTYCSACRILFQHKTSYQAHKMFYCRNGRKVLFD